LLQGKIYLRQLKYDKAVQLFDAVIEQDKQGRVVVEAILRKGDAYLGWGANDNSKYELALNSFQQAMQQKGALLSQWNEATFKKSKALQKLNRTDEALASYMDLLNGRGSESTEKQVPEYLWRIKGGLEAADMKQFRKDWKGALAVYRKLEQLGGPNQQEFRDAIHRIKRENFIYEDEG
jgi:tetratricopeptide (TPR) repeat protein